MANTFDVSSFTKKNGEAVAALRLKGDSTLDVVVTGDGTSTVLDLLKTLCSEVIAKDIPVVDPETPTPEWDSFRVVPAAGKQVLLVIGLRAETLPD